MRGKVIEQSTSQGLESAKKWPKLEDISMMAATTLQEWLETFPEMTCSMLHCFSTPIFQGGLVFRKLTLLLLLPSFCRRVIVQLDVGLMNFFFYLVPVPERIGLHIN